VAVGVGFLWLAAAIAAYGLFGVSLGVPFGDARGSPLPGSLGCLVIGAIWIFVWFAHLRILFDSARQELIVWTRGYLRSHERRVSLAGCRQFHIRHVRTGLSGSTWQVSAEFTDGRSKWLVDTPSGVESLAESLGAATKLPVTKHVDVS
jgi:hypothetical protein